MCVYSHQGSRASFEEKFRASGKKLDMGKSCVRFKKLEDLPLEVIGETIAATPVEDYIQAVSGVPPEVGVLGLRMVLVVRRSVTARMRPLGSLMGTIR